MEEGLKGRTALLTGGSSGITLAIARRYAEAGMNIALVARNEEKLAAAKAGIEALGAACIACPADVRDDQAVAGAFAATAAAFGGVDVIVAGAAGNFVAMAKDLSPKGFRTVTDIDTLGVFNTVHAGFAHLRKPGGVIIAISAPQATIAYPGQIHVAAAKAGIDMIVRTLALEWGPLGVRAVGISPGPIDQTEGMDRLAPTEAARARVVAGTPLRRMGEKAEVAELAAFLASDRAAYVTGAIIPCDGGLGLMGPAALG